MTEPAVPAPRPVSTLAVVAVFILLSAFGIMAHRAYFGHRPAAPQNEKPDNLGTGLDWRATPEARRAYLADLRKAQAKQAQTYAWVDQKKGIVQLPIDRAMDLVVKEEASR
ncbi:MAG TPA: hypothetical protein VG457_07435 [Planctomycetota bacterium]|jgi:hypothetical protein|nr:hypothetical protein [Planctomycetota bacterium]